MVDGFVYRYRADRADRSEWADGDEPVHPVDGLPPGEGAFLLANFWLVDNLELLGRHDEAVARFEALLALSNDVGLMAEEWDPADARMLGNVPQAFSHVGLINTAHNLARGTVGPALQRSDRRRRVASDPLP